MIFLSPQSGDWYCNPCDGINRITNVPEINYGVLIMSPIPDFISAFIFFDIFKTKPAPFLKVSSLRT